MEREEILNNFKKGRDKLNRRFINNQDEHGVLRENIGLDNLLKRDSMQYMRLLGTEKSFFSEPSFCELHKKQSNGQYKIETSGTLILTTRRLTFCQFSKRGKEFDKLDSSFKFVVGSVAGTIGGSYLANKLRKKEDWIIFSYPSSKLLGNSIKNSDKQNSGRKGFVMKELLLEDEEIKFVFAVEENKSIEDQEKESNNGIQLYQLDEVNYLFSMKLEHYMTYMKFFYQDSELYPSWDYQRNDNDEPYEDDFLSTKERNKLKKWLEIENEKYIFKYQGKNWLGMVKKGVTDQRKLSQEKFTEPDVKDTQSKESGSTKSILKKQKLNVSSISDELEKLAALKDKGILTEEEFSIAKAKLLN